MLSDIKIIVIYSVYRVVFAGRLLLTDTKSNEFFFLPFYPLTGENHNCLFLVRKIHTFNRTVPEAKYLIWQGMINKLSELKRKELKSHEN